MYKVSFWVNGERLLNNTYGSYKEMSEGITRVKALYAYKGNVKESITEL